MTPGELSYLSLALSAAAAFALTLAWVTSYTNGRR